MHACVSKHYYLLFYFSARSTVGRRRDERKSPFDNTLIGSLTFTWYGRKGLRMVFFYLPSLCFFFFFTRLSLILLGLASMPNYGLASPLVLFFFFHKRVSYVAPAFLSTFFLSSWHGCISLWEVLPPVRGEREKGMGQRPNDNQRLPSRCKQRRKAPCRAVARSLTEKQATPGLARFSRFARLG